MKNKLKVLVGAVALAAVALVAVHPDAGSSGDVAQAGLLPPIKLRIGVSWFDDLLENVFKGFRPRRPPVLVLRPTLDDVLRQQSWRPTVQRVKTATNWLTSDGRAEVVAKACDVMDELDADEWTSYDEAKALVEAANETVGHILGGAEALNKVLVAFAEGRADRFQVLGEQVVCQAAELRS
jgi:hypothetical protein